MPTRTTTAWIDIAGDESHGAWASGQHGVSTRIPLGCWARRALGRGLVDVAVSPTPARARRRRRGVGVGAGTPCWSGGLQRACEDERWCARARRGDRHGLRPDTDWKQAAWRSLGRRHGWRQTRRSQLGSARGNDGRWRSAHSPVKRAALPPLCPRARGNPPRRGHGGAADRSANWRSGAREGAKGPASPLGLRHARSGVHACARALRLARTRARTRTRMLRQRATAAAKTGWLPTARGARLGKRRARVGEGGGTCKKTRPSLARWPA
jgi:hypothetical protein